MDKLKLAEKIRKLDGLSENERNELLNLLNPQKKYGLVWEDKPEKVEQILTEKLPVLVEIPELRILKSDELTVNSEKLNEIKAQTYLFSKPEQTLNSSLSTLNSAPNHIIIEGDNLHAITTLTFTHEGKIDIIYIDPPYNTGNKDFIYNDKFVDKEDSYRHSKWLSFMHKRLKIAKRLLKDTGVIFISIDDNEQAQLKLLCDEIFGEENFHGNITWTKKTKPINSGKAKFQLQQQIEYIATYSKNPKIEFQGFNLRNAGDRNYKNYEGIGYCRLFDIEDSDKGMKNRETMKFPILGIIPSEGKRWKIGEETAKELLEKKELVIYDGKIKKVIFPEKDENPLKPFWSHFSKDDGKTSEDGKKLLSEIIGNNHNFDTVKPIELLSEIIFASSI